MPTKKSSATPSVIDQTFTRPSPYGTHAEPTYSGALSFLRRRYSKDVSEADVAVIGIPFDLATTNRPGTRFGPRAIREASANLAWCKPYSFAKDPCEVLNIIDWGDVFFDAGEPHKIPAIIEAQYDELLKHDVKPLSLGGDHFVAYPILRALRKKHGPIALIHFDAHSDTWRDADGRIDHGTMFYHAAKDGTVDVKHSIQIGMRTFNDDTHGYEVLDARWLHQHGVEECLKKIRARVGKQSCYVSFDIDFLDPAYAPGTGTPVIGGFNTHVGLELIRGLRGLNMIGMDVVEVSPPYDHSQLTSLAGASIALEWLATLANG
jgi:agmatinase